MLLALATFEGIEIVHVLIVEFVVEERQFDVLRTVISVLS